MNKRSCQNCLFDDQCPFGHPCSHYTPVEESEEDTFGLINNGREQFFLEWKAYLADEATSDF